MRLIVSVVVVAAGFVACSSSDSAGVTNPGNDGGAGGTDGSVTPPGTTITTDGGTVVVLPDGGTVVVPIDGGTLDATPRCTAAGAHGDLTSSVEPAPPAVATIAFMTDWTAEPASGGWQRTQIIDACRYHAEGSTWHGKAAARVEVDPGDDPLSLGEDSERAEMLNMQDQSGTQIPETGDVYFATSYYFPSTWDGTFLKGDENSWSFVMQLYPWGGLAAGRRAAGSPQVFFFTAGGKELDFTSGGTNALGKWTDFVLHVQWSTAHVTLWRRAEGATAFTQEIDDTGGTVPDGVYVKQGLYRGGDVSGRTDVLWIGPTARGASFAAVEQAAFGTNVGP